MSQQSPILTVSHLSTGYSGQRSPVVVSSDLNASLYPGQLTCLIGPNGAGKSTLLRTLTRFISPLAGTITLADRSLCEYSAHDFAQLVGVVLTRRININNMTVRQLVSLGRSPYTGFWGKLSPTDRQIVDSAIELMGISSLSRRMSQTLSDGERQKMMIAKALAQQTPIIFLDEPTAYLDYPSKVEIMLLLRRLATTRRLTIFMSTHDLELALQIADKVWLLDKTHGLNTGIPEDLALSGLLQRYFMRPGLDFDSENIAFKIDIPHHRSMSVVGSGIRYTLLCRALNRLGYRITDSADSIPRIEVLPETFLLDSATQVRTIADLLALL